MPPLHRLLPPTGSLVAFEAAARHLSITQAANELGLTQAAVSRKIRGLEENLGVALFRRLHRAIRLTPDGERLYAAVSSSLSHIAQTADDLRRSGGYSEVSLSTSMAFATFWLMPRIPRFRAAHPDIELRITAFDPYVDPASEGVDAAIRYGDGSWPGLECTRLFDEEIFPVCSPAYHAARPDFDSLASLPGQTLLHLDVAYHDWVDWGTWFRALDMEPPPRRRGLQFNTYTILIQAAVAGAGVALGWRHLVDDFLEAGVLVRPIETSLRSRGAYYLVRPEGSEASAEAGCLVDWIMAEIDGGEG